MSNNTSPWDYALINLRRLIYEKGLSNSSLVKAYVRANSVAMGREDVEPERVMDCELRRIRRLKTGDTKLSLRDVFILSQALDVEPGDLSFMSPQAFEEKYIEPIKDSVGKVEKQKKVWERPKNI